VTRSDADRLKDIRAGLRNVVVHEYFRVDPEMVRDIVDNQLAPLFHDIG
jgi:uncharacterized protein YutE (UPF0331/DUF86 family)